MFAHDIPSFQSGSGAKAGCAGAIASVVVFVGSFGVADDAGSFGFVDDDEEDGDGEEDDVDDGDASEQAATSATEASTVIERTTSA